MFQIFIIVLFTSLPAVSADKPHAVVVVGTHHYSPEKTMPVFAAELERLGFRTTVINPEWDAEKDERGLPGLEALKDADVAVFFIRFLKLEEEQLAHITGFLESGRPVVAFRTSTHGFNYPEGHPRNDLNIDFGRDAFGSPYLVHLSGNTKIKIVEGAEKSPILTGVTLGNWVSPGTLYLTSLESGAKPVLQGTGKAKPGKKKNAFGSHDLKAEMVDTVAWTWENQWGGRVFSTSLGHEGDFSVPQSMRVMVNGVFWAAGVDIPSAEVEVKVVGKGEENAAVDLTSAAAAKPKNKFKKRSKKKPKKEPEVSDTVLPNSPLSSNGLTLFYGNSFVERQGEDGSLEGFLQSVAPKDKLRFRSLAYTGDEVDFRIRPAKFGDHLSYISSQLPCERVIMCFGMNEAFAGAEGIEGFSKKLDDYIVVIKERHPDSNYVLVSPTAVEDSKILDAAETLKRNEDVELYTNMMSEVAEKNGVQFINLFSPSKKLYEESEVPLTLNGIHLNSAGNQAIAKIMAGELTSPEEVAKVDDESPGFEALRKLVSRKGYEDAMAYRPSNGIHYYGSRGRDFEYHAEIPHHMKLAGLLDEEIWNQASDLSNALAFPELPTEEAKSSGKRPRKGLGVIQTSQQDLAGFKVADGFEVGLFASSEDFPELINPLQINFDARGRLWVSTFESYPVPVPGTLANDKILILEDTDGDGRADKRTVFAENLKLPDGFVFYKEGIVVSVARQLIYLSDTDGDDKADVRTELLRGADDTDTHHGGYLSRNLQGKVTVHEGLFHRGQFETPHGVVRSRDASTFSFDVEATELVMEHQTAHPNPWKISFNTWGESIQMFGGGHIIDYNYYNVWTPVGTSSTGDMGMVFRIDKGCTLSFVSGDHFPKEWSGGLLTGHLLAMNSVMYTPLKLEGGTYVNAEKSVSLLSTKNKVFRPTDLEFGLDGALYISDFYYPIIGHAQHSIRDQNRDYTNGRIWRVTKKDSSLSELPKIEGADLKSLFALFSNSQVRVRELVRLELEKHPVEEVLKYAEEANLLAAGLENEEFGLELLWLYERANDFSHPELFRQLLASESLPVRRAAARSLRWWAPSVAEAKGAATELLKGNDDRTKIAVISAASHLQNKDSFWQDLIDQTEAPENTPVGQVVALAKLHGRPTLNPEFPLLKVSEDAKLVLLELKKGNTAGDVYVKSEMAQDLILSYAKNPALNVDINGIPMLRSKSDTHTEGGQINVNLTPGTNVITFFSEVNGEPVKGKIDLRLSNLVGNKPTEIQFAKDKVEHAEWAEAYQYKFATVTDDHIYIKTIPSVMGFNVKTFTVKAGRSYEFIFENLDHMLHNIVITKPGKEVEVGELADKMASQPDAFAKHYIPDTDMILLATPQISLDKKVTMDFKVPDEKGEYPFICTFPGHWRLMRGVMIVE